MEPPGGTTTATLPGCRMSRTRKGLAATLSICRPRAVWPPTRLDQKRSGSRATKGMKGTTAPAAAASAAHTTDRRRRASTSTSGSSTIGMSFRLKPSPTIRPASAQRRYARQRTQSAITRATLTSKRFSPIMPVATTAAANAAAAANDRPRVPHNLTATQVVTSAVSANTTSISILNSSE